MYTYIKAHMYMRVPDSTTPTLVSRQWTRTNTRQPTAVMYIMSLQIFMSTYVYHRFRLYDSYLSKQRKGQETTSDSRHPTDVIIDSMYTYIKAHMNLRVPDSTIPTLVTKQWSKTNTRHPSIFSYHCKYLWPHMYITVSDSTTPIWVIQEWVRKQQPIPDRFDHWFHD